jgi:hypothetical protein
MATWRSGDAADCKSVHAGSIPAVASNKIKLLVEKRKAPLEQCPLNVRKLLRTDCHAP